MNPTVVVVAVALLSSAIALAVSVWSRRQITMRPPGPWMMGPEEIAARASQFVAAGASPAVAESLARGDKILAIKRYREEHGVGLREGLAAIQRLAIEPRVEAMSATGASPAVVDALARGKQILAIKRYRQEHGVGLREAKEAIDRLAQAPQTPGSPTNLGG